MVDYRLHVFKSPEYRSVVEKAVSFFEGTPLMDFPVSESFHGTGVYGIYYKGSYPLYQKYTEINTPTYRLPIYIGKAVPPGWRVGRTTQSIEATTALFRRLKEHESNIRSCSDLNIRDFKYRFTILNDEEADLISTLESTLIRKHQPLWNNIVDGFGNHTPGEGRFDQACSEWDVLHPGRAWAARCRGEKPDINNVKREIADYFSRL